VLAATMDMGFTCAGFVAAAAGCAVAMTRTIASTAVSRTQ